MKSIVIKRILTKKGITEAATCYNTMKEARLAVKMYYTRLKRVGSKMQITDKNKLSFTAKNAELGIDVACRIL